MWEHLAAFPLCANFCFGCGRSPCSSRCSGHAAPAAATPGIAGDGLAGGPLRRPLPAELLAQSVHLTPSHISATFRQAVGSTITDYLTAVRVRQACLLLRTGGKSVEEIGRVVGLQNTSYLCQMFKKHVGISPTAPAAPSNGWRRSITAINSFVSATSTICLFRCPPATQSLYHGYHSSPRSVQSYNIPV